VVDLKTKLYFGSAHDVDSSEMSFKMAAHIAFRACFEHCHPILLEPIMTITVTTPGDHMGDVIGDLNSRRGKVMGTETKSNGAAVITAHVPMAEVLRYAPDLRSMTQGRGDFALEFAHYEELPAHLAERVVKDSQAARAAAHG
jgi:elongation factor G